MDITRKAIKRYIKLIVKTTEDKLNNNKHKHIRRGTPFRLIIQVQSDINIKILLIDLPLLKVRQHKTKEQHFHSIIRLTQPK